MWRFNMHVWGIVSSPFTATHVLHQVVADNRTHATEMITTAVRDNMYVDDVLKSIDMIEDAKVFYRQMKAVFANSRFTLTK